MPVRIQWDPERNLHLEPLPYRPLQMGLGGKAVALYVVRWIEKLTDVTDLAWATRALVRRDALDEAQRLLPVEHAYPSAEAAAPPA